jgi:hypothetical protein
MSSPVFTPVMGIQLPIPGETGALGVEPQGQSWMELQNTGFLAFDAHDHTGNGKGLPIPTNAIGIDIDLPFNNHGAVDLQRVAFRAQPGTLASSLLLSVYAVANGDLYYNNATGQPVQITSGNSVAGASGVITGMVPGTSVRYDLPTTSFIFEKASGVAAGINGGPIQVTDASTISGKKVSISAPAALAANYAITLPAALPASAKFLTISAAGQISADAYIDGTTLKLAGSSIGVDIDNVSIQYLSGKVKVRPVNPQISANTPGTPYTSTTPTAITNATVTITNVAGRPNMIMLSPQPTSLAGISLNNTTADRLFATIDLLRNGTVISQFSYCCPASPGGGVEATSLGAMPAYLDNVGAAGSYVYTMRVWLWAGSSGVVFVRFLNLVGYEM